MSCGYKLRCPECVDFKGAYVDKCVFKDFDKRKCETNYEQRLMDKMYQAQIKKLRKAILKQYPDWKGNI